MRFIVSSLSNLQRTSTSRLMSFGHIILADSSSDSIVLGFQLFCVLVNAFCPNTEFEALVRTFLRRFDDDEDGSITIMANCKHHVL